MTATTTSQAALDSVVASIAGTLLRMQLTTRTMDTLNAQFVPADETPIRKVAHHAAAYATAYACIKETFEECATLYPQFANAYEAIYGRQPTMADLNDEVRRVCAIVGVNR
jgi:hypothetical protein